MPCGQGGGRNAPMLQVTSFHPLLWRNRYSDHPVVVAEFAIDRATGDSGLSAEALAAIRSRFSAVSAGDVDLPEILAAICLSLQREKYEAPAAFGVERPRIWSD